MSINSNVVGIIADDLTGANDSALQFHLKGAKTEILLRDDIEPQNIVNTQIWAISTESRNVTPHEAYEKVKHTAGMFLDVLKPDYFFKKIDSTIRGNIAIEVIGVLEVLCADASIIVPAFPRENRITVGGYHLSNSELIERTEMARDPHSPIFESHFPTLLKSQLPDEFHNLVGTIDLSTITKGAGPILKELNSLIESGKKLIVADSVSGVDIEQLVLAITKSEYNILPTGTAALAKALSKVWVADTSDEKEKLQIPNLPKLVISGSATEITSKQIEKLKNNNTREAYLVDLDMLTVLGDVKEDIVDDVVYHLSQNDIVLVHTANLFKNLNVNENESLRAELTKVEIASAITDYLSELVKKIMTKTEFILITLGGETSYKCCAKIGATQLQLLDEVLPAIALSKDQNSHFIVTKSGNLGGEDTLIDILNYFYGE